jgi:hypothetical protein
MSKAVRDGAISSFKSTLSTRSLDVQSGFGRRPKNWVACHRTVIMPTQMVASCFGSSDALRLDPAKSLPSGLGSSQTSRGLLFAARSGCHGKEQEDQNRYLSSAKIGYAVSRCDRFTRRSGCHCRVLKRGSQNSRVKKDAEGSSRGSANTRQVPVGVGFGRRPMCFSFKYTVASC